MDKEILIIEDDKFLRDLIIRKLVQEGYKTSEAVDGEEGFKKIKEEKPALVLLDLILPGIDGFEVLAKIKENPELSKIPVMVISNLGQGEDMERAKGLGAVDYVIKAHFTPNEIVERIKSLLK
ncbi:MAG: response regulator [Candidatus Nealsonbacteria bacterium]|nr:response regulator [Candidatus Nealsonbacteria bacterium]